MKTNTRHPALLPPFHLSHPPPPLSSFPLLHHKDAGRKRDVDTQFSLPIVFNFLLKEKNSPSLPLTPSPAPFSPPTPLSLFSSWLLRCGRVSVTVTYKTVCYMRVNGYGGPTRGVEVEMRRSERGGLNEIDYRNESEGVLSIHFL